MMDKWAHVLKLFDLGEYESKTYATLVMNGASTVKDIRKAAGIPYSREYDILEGLAKRGFVKMQPGRPRIYSAVDPRKILKKECEIRVNVVEDLLDEIGPIYDKSAKSESVKEFFWTLEGEQNVRDKLVELIKDSEEEILIVGASPVSSKRVKEALKASIKRGVTIKCWGEFDSRTKSLLEDLGADTRFCGCDHSKYVLVDGKQALVSSEDPANSCFALYTTSLGCTRLYQSYFNHIWEEVA
jgi:sugar-specific transcriptional regulator TrmB